MTSFPYFTIAREHHALYGMVLAMAGVQERLLTFDPPNLNEQAIEAFELLSDECKTAIKAAVYTEYQRRGKEKFK